MKAILEIKDRCTACMACYNICKVKAIAMLEAVSYTHLDVYKRQL